MLVFDKVSLRCVIPPTDDCDIPSTTPPPEEFEQERPAQRPAASQSRPQAQRPQAQRPQAQLQQAQAARPQQQQRFVGGFGGA